MLTWSCVRSESIFNSRPFRRLRQAVRHFLIRLAEARRHLPESIRRCNQFVKSVMAPLNITHSIVINAGAPELAVAPTAPDGALEPSESVRHEKSFTPAQGVRDLVRAIAELQDDASAFLSAHIKPPSKANGKQHSDKTKR